MVVLLILLIAGLVVLGIIETVTTCELGSPISDKDISDYLDRIENENLINGVTKRWNDKFVLNVKGYTVRHGNNPSIFQTQYSLIFPYHITDVGVIPIWSKAYSRVKKLFKDNIENSTYKTDKRKKLGLD
jgi:hypothetical protein